MLGDGFVATSSACSSALLIRVKPQLRDCHRFPAYHGTGPIPGDLMDVPRQLGLTDMPSAVDKMYDEVMRLSSNAPIPEGFAELLGPPAPPPSSSARALAADTPGALSQVAPEGTVDAGSVTVTASVPEGGTAGLRLSNARTAASALAALRDDGAGGDSTAGDGIASASVSLGPGTWLGSIASGDQVAGAYVSVRDPVVTARGPLASVAVDSDGDGRVERYELRLPVDVARAGEYEARGELATAAGDARGLGTVTDPQRLETGARDVVVDVPAERVASAGDGSVAVARLELTGDDGAEVLTLADAGELTVDPASLATRSLWIGPSAAHANAADVELRVAVTGPVEAVEVSEDGYEAWQAVELTRHSPASATGTIRLAGLDEGFHRIVARAKRDGAITDEWEATTVNVDRTAPTITTFDAGTSEWSNERSRTLQRAVAGASQDVVWETAVGPGDVVRSQGPAEPVDLPEGEYEVRTRAIDPAGNASEWVSRTVRIDTTPPDTELAPERPAAITSQTSATLSFSSTDAAFYECRLDEQEWSYCWSYAWYSWLLDGRHTFSARAVDAAGNRDPSPASWSWTVDTAAPEVRLDSGPPDPTNEQAPAIAFSTPESGVTFTCRVDAGVWAPCASPHELAGLADGRRDVAVRAVDGAGNVGEASRSFTVDRTPPESRIAYAWPWEEVTTARQATFQFGPAEEGISFECALDDAPLAPCSSWVELESLALGAHRMRVRARDAAGNVDPTEEVRSWRVVEERDGDEAAPPESQPPPPQSQPPPQTDEDGDAVPDALDRCPGHVGVATSWGCPAVPPSDADGDSVPDFADACPSVRGAQPVGCPVAQTGPDPGSWATPTSAADALAGDPLANVICGLGGNDTISGRAGDDTLFGDACNDKAKTIFGAAAGTDGDDRLSGDDGDDALYGAGGRDILKGGRGRDRLFGGAGGDTLDGDAGNDKLVGGRDPNTVRGGPGDDSVDARNGRKDRIDCGPGKKDSAKVDKTDRVKGCEKVRRSRR
jgi:hypothetical protein